MSKTKEKISFGIFKDGLRVKIAQLSLENGIVSIQDLKETTLSSELIHKEERDHEEIILPLDEHVVEDNSENKSETFSMKMITEIENLGELDGSNTKSDVLPGLLDLQNFLQQFPLEKGKISLNANDEQISYFQFDSSYGTKKLRKRLLNEMLSKNEIKAKDYCFDYLVNPDNSGLAYVYNGKFRFFHALRDINLMSSKEKYYYSYIDPNPISIMNLVNHNYDFFEDDYVLILYIGYDYKVGIILKNGMHVKTFPIIVPDDEASMRETIYSKVLLEQDISDVPITKNILLAGDNATDEDLKYFRSLSQEGDSISRIELEHITIQEGLEDEITPEDIAKYAIPIALAWKTLEPKNTNFFSTNLLPTKVIENQKYSKIAWHGYVMITAMMIVAFYGTLKNLELKQEISNYEKKNYGIERVLSENQILIERLNEIREKINSLQESLNKVERVIGKKNQWNHILKALATSMNKNRLTWFYDITSNSGGFNIDGYTTNRRAVLALSKIFPRSRITKVTKTDLSRILAEKAHYKGKETNIWNFNISMNYPDPKSWEQEEHEEIEEKPKNEMVKEVEVTSIEDIEEVSEVEVIEVITETTDEVSEKYHSILSLYFAGKTDDAYTQFSEFVKSYPQHKMAYYAKYLIGECLYAMGYYSEARDTLQKVYELGGSKSPDALIMMGNCSENENDPDTAVQYWSTMIEKFPNYKLSKIAQHKIDKIKGR